MFDDVQGDTAIETFLSKLLGKDGVQVQRNRLRPSGKIGRENVDCQVLSGILRDITAKDSPIGSEFDGNHIGMESGIVNDVLVKGIGAFLELVVFPLEQVEVVVSLVIEAKGHESVLDHRFGAIVCVPHAIDMAYLIPVIGGNGNFLEYSILSRPPER